MDLDPEDLNSEELREKCKEYESIGTNEILSKTFFRKEEAFYIILSGKNKPKKDVKAYKYPYDILKNPDDDFSFRFRDSNHKWRGAKFIKCDQEGYQLRVEIGDLYVPFWKKPFLWTESVYGKIPAKLKNLFSGPP